MANASDLTKPNWDLYETTENPEHDLFQNYIVEFTDISGIRIAYYPRDNSPVVDRLYGENTSTKYLTPQTTKMVYEVTEETSMTNSFGIVSEEMIQYAFIPKYTFTRDVSGGVDPTPGDVIKVGWNDRNYEIVDVGEEAHIFQLKKMIWELILKPYRFSEQSSSSRAILKTPDSTLVTPVSGYGDNDFIDDESDAIDDYDDVDTDFYGF
jgi:hypothetical protein